MSAGTNLEQAHQHNRRAVLEAVRLHSPLSRGEISKRTGLSLQTISNLVGEMLEQGLVRTQVRQSSGRGQPAADIVLNGEGGHAVGLHLDRDHLTGVLVNLSGQVQARSHLEWRFPTPADVLPQLEQVTRALGRDAGVSHARLWGVGVALPGPLDIETGRLLDPPNFPGWEGVAITDLIADRLGLKVLLDTDATAAAVGELWHGRRGLRDLCYVYFGVGLGSGLIVNGEPYRGAYGNAGILGHIPVPGETTPCSCGNLGCLETVVSLQGVYRALGLHGLHPEGPELLERLSLGQDPRLLAWLERASTLLGHALLGVERMFEPAAFIFGGRLPSPLLEALMSRVAVHLERHPMRGLPQRTALLPGQASEDAAALGAAALPLHARLAPTFGGLIKSTAPQDAPEPFAAR